MSSVDDDPRVALRRELERVLADRPLASFDELQATLDATTRRCNMSPQAELGGLSWRKAKHDVNRVHSLGRNAHIGKPMINSTVQVFDSSDAAYTSWLRANSRGFVINSRRNRPPDYMVLHRAACRSIDPGGGARAGAFTERGYIKICSTDLEALRRSVGQESGCCGLCKPG